MLDSALQRSQIETSKSGWQALALSAPRTPHWASASHAKVNYGISYLPEARESIRLLLPLGSMVQRAVLLFHVGTVSLPLPAGALSMVLG